MGGRVRTFIILVVAVVWAANFITPIFNKDYQPSPELNVAFMAIIGFATASVSSGREGRHRDTGEGNREEDDPPNERRNPGRGGSGGVEE